MTSSSCGLVTRRTSSLSALRPGMTGVTPSRVRVAPSRESRRSLPLREPSSGPWQEKHLSERMGRTSRLKSIACVAGAAAEAAAKAGAEETNASNAQARIARARRGGRVVGWACDGPRGIVGNPGRGGATGAQRCPRRNTGVARRRPALLQRQQAGGVGGAQRFEVGIGGGGGLEFRIERDGLAHAAAGVGEVAALAGVAAEVEFESWPPWERAFPPAGGSSRRRAASRRGAWRRRGRSTRRRRRIRAAPVRGRDRGPGASPRVRARRRRGRREPRWFRRRPRSVAPAPPRLRRRGRGRGILGRGTGGAWAASGRKETQAGGPGQWRARRAKSSAARRTRRVLPPQIFPTSVSDRPCASSAAVIRPRPLTSSRPVTPPPPSKSLPMPT
jgi:hypothetical protein